ncbi:hypothetical protein WJX74_009321 [Apatococcus lobatus]|uniref:Uncharacterized protein n=1 Tax=Apatococcus lobatus TaxID=904363 RepID=A0AAW1QMY4_9CHLO
MSKPTESSAASKGLSDMDSFRAALRQRESSCQSCQCSNRTDTNNRPLGQVGKGTRASHPELAASPGDLSDIGIWEVHRERRSLDDTRKS